MRKEFVILILLILLFAGCNDYKDKKNPNNPKQMTVTKEVTFRVFSGQKTLSDVIILLVDNNNGKVVNKLKTNSSGEISANITIPVDQKYNMNYNELQPRGTVTAIAYKEGYREKVLFEVPISSASAVQPFNMEPVIKGGRNEPTYEVGNNHRLEVISLVEKYTAIIKKKN